MVGDGIEVPRGAVDTEVTRQRVEQPTVVVLAEEGSSMFRCGDQVSTVLLRERTQQRGDEVFAEPGDLPVEPRAGLVQPGERDVDGDAVELGAGIEHVAEWKSVEGVGEPCGIDVALDEQLAGVRERHGLVAPPAVEVT